MANPILMCKITFLVIGIVSTAILTYNFALPYLLHFFSESLPKLRNSVLTGKILPFYLFITVHFLILVVWKLHGIQHPDAHDQEDKQLAYSSLDSKPIVDEIPDLSSSLPDVTEIIPDLSSSLPVVAEITEDDSDDNKLSEKSMEQVPWPPPEEDEVESVEEEEEEENVSMDDIWKSITEGLSSPKDQHLIKKSDTWEKSKDTTTVEKEMRKSETFREKTNATSASATAKKKDMRKSETFRESTSGWRGRDRLLLVQDELFSKVEAFIKMNKDQMRVRRQESDHRYVEMVNAAY